MLRILKEWWRLAAVVASAIICFTAIEAEKWPISLICIGLIAGLAALKK